jgi:hypothetical protein
MGKITQQCLIRCQLDGNHQSQGTVPGQHPRSFLSRSRVEVSPQQSQRPVVGEGSGIPE